MFDKLKQLKKMKDLHKKMKNKTHQETKDGVVVAVNGNMEIVNVDLNDDLSKDKQADLIKKLTNQAFKKIRRDLATQFKGQL